MQNDLKSTIAVWDGLFTDDGASVFVWIHEGYPDEIEMMKVSISAEPVDFELCLDLAGMKL